MGGLAVEEYMPLRDVVYETLRQKIIHGELKPGEHLTEVSLSKRLGVSRTPVREAVHKLEQDGLVVMEARRGAFVSNISEKNVKDVLEIRKELERFAVKLAAERITSQEKVILMQAEEGFASASKGNDLKKIAQKDENFHEVIYKATKNEKLDILINNLREQMYRFRFEYIKDAATRQHLREEHYEITHAIIKGDAETAQRVISAHIENQEKSILNNIRQS